MIKTSFIIENDEAEDATALKSLAALSSNESKILNSDLAVVKDRVSSTSNNLK